MITITVHACLLSKFLLPVELRCIIVHFVIRKHTNQTIRDLVKIFHKKGLSNTVLMKYGDIPCWDTSQVTDMSSLFYNCKLFDIDISGWDVSNVTNMSCMFYYARSFNQPLEKWDVSNVVSMKGMFSSASFFDQPLGK